jgi:aldehyde dehydrogenase (NAD+)
MPRRPSEGASERKLRSRVAAAPDAGCTAVLKSNEIAPLNALSFTGILEEAGTPSGVFNPVNGDEPTVD